MAKRKYLALIMFLPFIASASPWLPDEEKYIFISSAYLSGKSSMKIMKAESKAYYTLEQEIKSLESSKPEYIGMQNLTPEAVEHRLKSIDGKIQNLRNLQSRLSSFYSKSTISQTVEYGINNKYSFNFKAFMQFKKQFIGNAQNCNGFEIGPKIKIKQTEKYIISTQPSIGIHTDIFNHSYIAGEARLLIGRATPHKFGKKFQTLEIAPGFSGKFFECRMDCTTGIEIKNGVTFMLQTYNNFKPKADKVYRQTSLEQF